jgi:capsular polysaccharide transport system permease protein
VSLGNGTISRPLKRLGLLESMRHHARLISALIAREIQSRFGESRFSYAANYIAPLAWIAATYFAFMLLGRIPPVYTDTITFILSGLIPYAAFRYVVTAIGRSRSVARKLLIYPSVTEEHAMAAAAMLEFVNALIFFALVSCANYLIFGNGELAHPLLFFWGLALSWGLGVGYASLFAVLSRYSGTFNQIGQVILRPSFFLSGVFFTANELPDHFLAVLGWNPLLHAIDIARDGMLFHYQSRVASSLYVVACIVALLSAAAIASRARRI